MAVSASILPFARSVRDPDPLWSAAVDHIRRTLPGLGMCVLITAAATLLAAVERRVFGAAWLESLVLAIIVGAAVRTAWTPSARWQTGIDFSAKMLLEIAVVLLGASVSARTVLAAGPGLLAGIATVVVLAICCSYGIGRMFGLPHRMATLIACGNSICGNSAIAAVAPVIGADGEDVAASIAFTALFGVVLVLLLPLAVPLLHLTHLQYGALAGLTVYAVPQVLAATAPVGTVAVQLGTLVKLVRVLMLGAGGAGPVAADPLVARRDRRGGAARHRGRPSDAARRGAAPAGSLVHRGLPWACGAAVGRAGAACGAAAGVLDSKPC